MPKGSWREFGSDCSNDTSKGGESGQVKFDRKVRVQKTRVGKSGKTVTVVTGIGLTHSDAKSLLKRLKS